MSMLARVTVCRIVPSVLYLMQNHSVSSCHSCNICNDTWRKVHTLCSGVNIQSPPLLSDFRAGLATSSKLRTTVQARGCGEPWTIVPGWRSYCRNCEWSQNNSKLAKKCAVFAPSRKSCKQSGKKELWTTQVCCISPLYQGLFNNFWAAESFILSTLSLPETNDGN